MPLEHLQTFHIKNKHSMPTVSAEDQVRMQIQALNPNSSLVRETSGFQKQNEIAQKQSQQIQAQHQVILQLQNQISQLISLQITDHQQQKQPIEIKTQAKKIEKRKSPAQEYLDKRHQETQDKIFNMRILKHSGRQSSKTKLQEKVVGYKYEMVLKKERISNDTMSPKFVSPKLEREIQVGHNQQQEKNYQKQIAKNVSFKLKQNYQIQNLVLMQDKHQEVMQQNGFHFKPNAPGSSNSTGSSDNSRNNESLGQKSSMTACGPQRTREDLMKWHQQLQDRKVKMADQYYYKECESYQKASRMCPGTIKILHSHGQIEKKKDELGQIIVVGSPEKAGARLYNQAVDSIMRKRQKQIETFMERELLSEPGISYPGTVITKAQQHLQQLVKSPERSRSSKRLLSPVLTHSQSIRQMGATQIFGSLNHVAEVTAKLPMDLVSAESIKSLQLKKPHEIFMDSRNSGHQLPKSTQSAFTYQSFQSQVSSAVPIDNFTKIQQPRVQMKKQSLKLQQQPKKEADLMRAKLNMFIKDKYSCTSQSSMNNTNNNYYQQNTPSCQNDKHQSEELITNGQHSDMVAQLDKLTPCIRTLQGQLSPDYYGKKSTLKRSGGCRTSLGSTYSNKIGFDGRLYEGNLPKVSFDFSNLELNNQKGPRSGLMEEEEDFTHDPSLSNLRQQDQPIYYGGKPRLSSNDYPTFNGNSSSSDSHTLMRMTEQQHKDEPQIILSHNLKEQSNFVQSEEPEDNPLNEE